MGSYSANLLLSQQNSECQTPQRLLRAVTIINEWGPSHPEGKGPLIMMRASAKELSNPQPSSAGAVPRVLAGNGPWALGSDPTSLCSGCKSQLLHLGKP